MGVVRQHWLVLHATESSVVKDSQLFVVGICLCVASAVVSCVGL